MGITGLKVDGKLVTSAEGKANALNNQFKSAFTRESPLPLSNLCKGGLLQRGQTTAHYPQMQDIVVTQPGVEKLLRNLDPHKAAGPDHISPHILKELATEISLSLTIIYNKSIQSGVVPAQWREAIVCPVFKKGQKYLASNYRPISLTCVACKVLEHIFVSALMKHAAQHNILYDLQHGFRSQRSCETQLI